MDITAIATIVTIIAGIIAIYSFFFGPKPLVEVLSKLFKSKENFNTDPIDEATTDKKAEINKGDVMTSSTTTMIERGTEYFNNAVEEVISLVSSSQYVQAQRGATKLRTEIILISDQSRPDIRLLLGELDVWYAHATMYVGETEIALNTLKDIVQLFSNEEHRYEDRVSFARWCNILGRAYNHIGYINWINLGHYEIALQMFREAIRVLSKGALEKELATALDNLGRVYAHLGYETRSELLIGHGLKLRKTDVYRYALSLNSVAISSMTFGKPERASLFVDDAYQIFKQTASRFGERGIGLALLTKGQSLRYLGSQSYPRPWQQKLDMLTEAIKILKDAEAIFRSVGEEIRLFQAINELGCVYRERATLFKQDNDIENALRSTTDARNRLEESINLAKGSGTGYKYRIYFVDACEDLARLYFNMRDYTESKRWIATGQKAILPEYKFVGKSRFYNVLPSECFDDFWQQLGKINLLLGEISYTNYQMDIQKSKKSNLRSLESAIEHYLLSAAYYGRFSERPLAIENKDYYPQYRPQLAIHQQFIVKWYDLISSLDVDHLLDIKSRMLPNLVDRLDLDVSWLNDLVVDPIDCII
jgi:tetratricopeptide (TPR) repeat protein